MSDDNVIDFTSKKPVPQEPKTKGGSFSFCIMNPSDGNTTEENITGYLKFGPQFIAVVDGPEDSSNVIFAVATHLVKYVKRLENDLVQGTLSLGG